MPQSLGHSSSDSALVAKKDELKSSQSSASLKAAGAALAGETTSLYDRMKSEGWFREFAPAVPAAGRSTIVPLADSAERDLQSEIYFAAPATPIRERRFRDLSHGPGEIKVHHGLKDQKLPSDEFRYGLRGCRGSTAEDAMKAGQLMGVAEYKNSVAERVYESSKREPLGKPCKRGHEINMPPDGFGHPKGEYIDGKLVLYPVDQPQDCPEHDAMYRKTHNQYKPGERIVRGYVWPEETTAPNFRFGVNQAGPAQGAGMRLALNTGVEDDGSFKRTKLVQKVCEDYRNVQHPKVLEKKHCKQGATGPPLPHDHRYGIKSGVSDYTAASCIKGYYSLEEQLPDKDLGMCTKPGRRNVTSETRAFGTPSVRTDIAPPPDHRRSCADMTAYGHECGCAALINPQRFDPQGVPDSDFLVRRPREELEQIVARAVPGDIDFDELFNEAVNLFDDGVELASLDAILYITSQKIDEQVAQMHAPAGTSTAQAV